MQDGEVLIPVNLPTEIQLRTRNIYDNKNMEGYECILMVDDEAQTVKATRQSTNSVACTLAKYTYKEPHQEMKVSLTVKWNHGNFIVDDIHEYTVTLYDCSINRRDCSECLSEISTRLPLNCGWCTGSRTCEVQNVCESEWWPHGTSNKCDFPTITDVFPISGPYEGRTQIIIMGTDLGKRTSDMRSVTVANTPCALQNERYEVSKRFECITGVSLPDESGAIVVQVQANHGAIQTATYRKQFIYRDPDVLDFTPKIGPKSGGTMVTIIGQYVNAGRNIKAYFGASSCHIDRTESVVNETHLLCTTTMTNATNSAKLSIYFDGAERLAPDYKTFVFTNDPEVSSFYPMTSMISGGRAINVTGQYFTSIQRPKMFVNAGKLFVSLSTVSTFVRLTYLQETNFLTKLKKRK
ncbi:plexin-A2-like [Ptychodera flava]|uniref:plexin-A2-like n=1 Tax=Ptychodera flava TaxID=63121 RepID=UPI00396A9254